MQTGDDPLRVEGIVSGSMSYIFNRIHADENITFSQAYKEAKDKGLLSSNLLSDVSGHDTAQKMLVIARELGMQVEMEDVKIDPLHTNADFDADFDAEIAARRKEAVARGERLCYIGDINVHAGTVRCGLMSLPLSHRLTVMQSSDEGLGGNKEEVTDQRAITGLVFTTRRYPEQTPLCVHGPAAGPTTTAAGIMADLMRLSRQLG